MLSGTIRCVWIHEYLAVPDAVVSGVVFIVLLYLFWRQEQSKLEEEGKDET